MVSPCFIAQIQQVNSLLGILSGFAQTISKEWHIHPAGGWGRVQPGVQPGWGRVQPLQHLRRPPCKARWLPAAPAVPCGSFRETECVSLELGLFGGWYALELADSGGRCSFGSGECEWIEETAGVGRSRRDKHEIQQVRAVGIRAWD